MAGPLVQSGGRLQCPLPGRGRRWGTRALSGRLDGSVEEKLEYGRRYPFSIPEYGFSVEDGHIRPLDDVAIARLDLEGLTPVIGCGSNRAPEQLGHKFRGLGLGPVVCLPARMPDHDVVYSAHISSYGAIPATIVVSTGTVAEVSVAWLNDRQLARMDETEQIGVNYLRPELTDIELTVPGRPVLRGAVAYVSKRGALKVNGAAVALAEIKAEGRRLVAWEQMAARRHVAGLVGGTGDVEDVLRDLIANAEARRRASDAIARDALPYFGD